MESITPDRLSTMFNQFPLGLVLLERTGEAFFVNDTLTAMTGAEGFELIGQGFYDVLFPAPEVNDRIRQKTLSALESAFDDLDLTISKPGDERATLHISGGLVREGEAEFIVLVVQDVTSKKAFEKVIESSFDNFIQVTNALDAATKKLNEQNAILEEYKAKMTRELNIAKSVQKAIIPTKFPHLAGFQMYGVSIPSDELGGDYFDYFLLDADHVGVLIADVSGHGVPSSLITTMVKAYFEYYTKRFLEPEKVLANVNRDMSAIITDTGFYLTALYAVLELSTRTLLVSVAGHDAALSWNAASGTLQRLGEGCDGTILGVFPEATYSSMSYHLEAGSKVILFTDGITEARSDDGEFYGNARLEAFLKGQAGKSSEESVLHLVRDIDAFYGTNLPNDDRTLVVFDLLAYDPSRQDTIPDNSEVASTRLGGSSLVRARQLFRDRHFAAALRVLEGLIDSGTDSAEIRALAGQARAHVGNDAEAVVHLSEAWRLEPRVVRHGYYLGLALFNVGRHEDARAAWQRVLELEPNYKDTVGLLARLNPT